MMEWYLHHLNGLPHNPSLLRIHKNMFKVGRNIGSDCLLKSSKVSRAHANLHLIGQKLLIQDMNTMNGTFVNKEKLEPMALRELQDKDLISFGLIDPDQVEGPEDKLVFFQVMSSVTQARETAGSDSEASVCTVTNSCELPVPLATSSLTEATPARTSSSHNRQLLGKPRTLARSSSDSDEDQLFKVPRVPIQIKSESDSGGVVSSTVNEDILPPLENPQSCTTQMENSAGLSTSGQNCARPSTSYSAAKASNVKRKHSLESRSPSKKTRYDSSSSDDNSHDPKKDRERHSKSSRNEKHSEDKNKNKSKDIRKSIEKSKQSTQSSSHSDSCNKEKKADETKSHKSSKEKHHSNKNRRSSGQYSEKVDKTNKKSEEEKTKNAKEKKKDADKQRKKEADKKVKSSEAQQTKNNKKSPHNNKREEPENRRRSSNSQKEEVPKSDDKRHEKRKSSTSANDENKEKQVPPSTEHLKPPGSTWKPEHQHLVKNSSGNAGTNLNEVSMTGSLAFVDVTAEVIEISSSDDEDIFASSQLFNRYNVKTDPIKMEMEALMGEDVPPINNELINLEEDANFAGFDNTQEICAVLEEELCPGVLSEHSATLNNPRVEIYDTRSEVESKTEDTVASGLVWCSNKNAKDQPNSVIEKSTNKHARKETEKTVENPSTSSKLEDFSVSTDKFFKSSKSLVKTHSDNWIAKRRSPSGGTSAERKRPKSSLGHRINQKEGGSTIDQSTKKMIQEERRKKLKDLTEKSCANLPKEKKKATAPKTMPESKTFRGGFLLEEGPKTPKRPTKSNAGTSAESSMSITRSKSLSNLLLASEASVSSTDLCTKVPERKQITRRKSMSSEKQIFQRSATPNPAPPERRRTRSKSVSLDRSIDSNDRVMTRARSRTPAFDRLDSSPYDRPKSVPPIRSHTICSDDYEPRYNFRQRASVLDVSSSRPSLRMEVMEDEDMIFSQNYNPNLMWGESPSTSAPEKRLVPEMRKIDIQDVILKMVCWSPYWIEDQMPQVTLARRMPLTFNNMIEYEDTLTALMLLEIWQHCYQSQQPNRVTRETISVAHIEHTRVNGRFLNIDCQCYTSNEEYKQNLLPKYEDFALYEHTYGEKHSDGSIKKTVSTKFAYISRVNKRPIKDTDKIKSKLAQYCKSPDWLIEYTLSVFHRPGKEPTKSFIILKPLLNIGGFLKMIKAVKNLRHSPLCTRILLPKIGNYRITTTHHELICPLANEQLNNEQLQAVLEGASLCTRQKPGIYCITGPPGTGKSTVIVNLILQILFSNRNSADEPKILLVAPSNTAVDNILLKLVNAKDKLPLGFDKHNIKQIRIGPENAINQVVKKYSLPSLVTDTMLQSLKHHSKYNAAIRNNTVNQLISEAYGTRYEAESRKVQNILLKNSNIVCTTLSSCVTQKVADLVYSNTMHFDCCIIDEATQCHEMESLLPTLLGIDQFVLVGDPKQLHATVLNREAQSLGFNQSLFSRIANTFSADPRSPIRTLTTQYRMHEEICRFPNKAFYEGKLRSEPKVEHRIPPTIRPYLVFNITAKPKESPESYVNIEEIHLIKMLLTTIFQMIDLSHTYTVGIITPYNNQKNLINKNVMDLRMNPHMKITVNTVDSFQGMENDIVIISCVRDSTNSFLQNTNRLNVALTRAKQALYIIGNYTLFKECRTLYDLREDAKKRKVLLDIKQDPTTITNFEKYLLKR